MSVTRFLLLAATLAVLSGATRSSAPPPEKAHAASILPFPTYENQVTAVRILKRLVAGTRKEGTFYTASSPLLENAPDLAPNAAAVLASVLQRTADRTDSLPRSLAKTVKNVVDFMNNAFPSEFQPGTPLLPSSRRTLTISDKYQRQLYLMPTTNGWVCYAFTGAEEDAQCVRNLVEGLYFFNTQRDATGSLLVHGLVSEERVAEVTVDVDGTRYPAALGGGTFFVGIDNVAPQRRIEIHFVLDDGRVVTTQA